MSTSEHLSSSAVQVRAETVIVAAVAAARQIDELSGPCRIALSGDVHIEVDAATPDRQTVVEAYARPGKLEGAQPKKIAQDILELALLKREPHRENTLAIIAFASREARDSISGRLVQAAERFQIELMVVDIPEDLRQDILRAQSRQIMVNTDHVIGDLIVETS